MQGGVANVNCLHIILIVINEMPIFIAKHDYLVYFKKNEVTAPKTYFQSTSAMLTYSVSCP
jgi:hypothetical protein